MYISKRNAAYIVEEISKIIGEKINMMNDEGVIIASSDAKRIGSYHAAAKELIENNLQKIVVKNDFEYEGARSGINLAVNFEDKIVGVIGVTGPYENVSKYGQILKKMTEILILDQYYKEQHDTDRRIKERYLYEWIFGESKNIDQQFIRRGDILKVDITLPRRMMAISFFSMKEQSSPKVQRMIDSAEKIITDKIDKIKNSVYLKNGLELLCAVPDCSDQKMIELAECIKEVIENKYPIIFCCGIDACYEGYLQIHNNVIKAKKALKTSLRSPQKGIRLYESISMEIFQSELSSDIKLEYINRIFKGCSAEEIENWMRILNIFYEEEGSIIAAAQRLFIHKNTLQYKLNKIKEKTGYDPRSIRYSSLYYNAIHFYQDVHDKIVVY